MRKIHLIAILFFLSLGCFGPKLEEVDFFQVSTSQPEFLAQLGKVKLKGVISGVGATVISDFGFYWSESKTRLDEDPETANQLVVEGLATDGEFEKELPPLSLDKTYYFLAYAKAGGRAVFGEPQQFTLQVNLNNVMIHVENNSATINSTVTGLETLRSAVAAHGHVWSAENPEPRLENSDTTNLNSRNSDGDFTSTLENLKFNTSYFIRPYLRTNDTVYYSRLPDTFRIRDGWERVSTFPTPVWNAIGAASEEQGFIGFGCPEKECLEASLSNKFWSFQPDGQWERISNFPVNLASARSKGVMFVIRDKLYVGLGEYNAGSHPIFLSDFWAYDFMLKGWNEVEEEFPGTARSGAVAFVLNDKAYIGTGTWSLAGQEFLYFNDFWEFDPAAEGNLWREVRSLPQKTGPESSEFDDGREGASAMVIDGKAFVGGGVKLGLLLNDFWMFIPPSEADSLGSWESHSFFPGKPRFDAIAFSIAGTGKGYYGIGANFDNLLFLRDFWEFDPNPAAGRSYWLPRTEFQGERRARAVAFSIGDFGYLGTGEGRIFSNNTFNQARYDDFWKYWPER